MARDFGTVKKKVIKRYPNAKTMYDDNEKSYHIVDKYSNRILTEEYYMPPATTVRKAWEQIERILFVENMMEKSFNAFSDEKMNTQILKQKSTDDV